MLPRLKIYSKYRVCESFNEYDFSTQTEENLICYLCDYRWENKYDLYSHVITQCHKNNKYFTCLRCKFKLNPHSIENHDCLKHKSTYLKHVSFNLIKFGIPLICLLCQGRKFCSKVMLFVHLLCYHSPNVVNLNKCGICTYKIKRKKLNKKLEQFCLPQYNKEFDKHIQDKHIYGYDLSFINQLNTDTEKRHPYACIACSSILNSNDQFHAHIICQHATKNEFDKEIFVCLVCNIPYWCPDKFLNHVNNTHTLIYRQLAIQLSKDGSINNYVDLETLCVYCWTSFEKCYQLHFHILIQHSYFSTSIQCGLCSMDFKINKELFETYNLFKNHNEAHFIQFEFDQDAKNNIFSIPEVLTMLEEMNDNNIKKKHNNIKKKHNNKNNIVTKLH